MKPNPGLDFPIKISSSAYSYYVEVSVDNISWTRIIDYRAYLCRSWQKLYFPPTVATYV